MALIAKKYSHEDIKDANNTTHAIILCEFIAKQLIDVLKTKKFIKKTQITNYHAYSQQSASWQAVIKKWVSKYIWQFDSLT